MNTKRTLMLFIALAAMALAVPTAVSAADPNSYRDALDAAQENYRKTLTQCDSLSNKSRSQCRDEAEDTLEKQQRQAERQREAGYEAAMEKCESLHFNNQDVCEKEAAADYGKNH
jgi:hypothetical protein